MKGSRFAPDTRFAPGKVLLVAPNDIIQRVTLFAMQERHYRDHHPKPGASKSYSRRCLIKGNENKIVGHNLKEKKGGKKYLSLPRTTSEFFPSFCPPLN